MQETASLNDDLFKSLRVGGAGGGVRKHLPFSY